MVADLRPEFILKAIWTWPALSICIFCTWSVCGHLMPWSVQVLLWMLSKDLELNSTHVRNKLLEVFCFSSRADKPVQVQCFKSNMVKTGFACVRW